MMFVKNAPDGKYVNGTRGVVDSFDKNEGFPVVQAFNGDMILAEPEEWKLEENGTVRATLTQVPLRLAWAITIHKSQGMTLDTAEIDLSDAFEPGMGYVALSRVRTLSGLKLLGLNDVALSVNPKVLLHDAKFREWSSAVSKVLQEFPDEEKQKNHEEVLFERFEGFRDKEIVKKMRKEKVKRHGKKIPTQLITAEFLEKKMSLAEIASERGLTLGTVISHAEKLSGAGKLPDITYLKADIKDFDKILAEWKKSKDGKLTPIFKKFKGKIPFETLRLVRLFVD